MDFKKFYQQSLSSKNYQADASQLRGAELVFDAYTNWVNNKNKSKTSIFFHLINSIRFIFKPKQKITATATISTKSLNNTNKKQGVYLWGGVGRGKSFLMDTFYQYIQQHKYYQPNLNNENKNSEPENNKHKHSIGRLHFHEFMRDIHKRLENLRGTSDPIEYVAKDICKLYTILCFDEFHVNDIADAMIFDRLFHALFKQGIFIILTSNYHADDLYLNGLHRERFLPAIQLLKQVLFIQQIDGGQDYRLRTLQNIHMYHTPITQNTHPLLMDIFKRLSTITSSTELEENAKHTNMHSNKIYIENRSIDVKFKSHNIVWFDFMSICHSPRSQNDYLEIAMQYATVIISDIPYMPPNMSSTARRFTWLVDIFYDYKVKLIISAVLAPHLLYTEGLLANEFQRTVSRLIEMQSFEYLNAQHK